MGGAARGQRLSRTLEELGSPVPYAEDVSPPHARHTALHALFALARVPLSRHQIRRDH